jgi:membrane fusion protein (multidrug efflux system)
LAEIDARDFQAELDAARAAFHAAKAAYRSFDIDVNLTAITTSAGLGEAQAAVTAAEAMVQNAKASAAGAKSRLGEAEAQVAFARAALNQARAELTAVEARYHQASLDLERFRQLADSKTISPQQLDHADTAKQMAAADLTGARSKVDTQQFMLQRAQASLKAARDNVNQSLAQVAARQAQLEQSEARLASARSAPVQVSQSSSRAEASKADVEKARAKVEQATLKLSYTRIQAPADGYVTKKNIESGMFVQVGQSLMALVTPNIWVTANFKETQLTHLQPGQPASICADAFPDAVFHGRVDSIQRGTGARFSLLPPENATGNFVKVVQRVPVKIVFDRPEELGAHLLVPGMSVVPKVNIRAEGDDITAGKKAITTDPLSATP